MVLRRSITLVVSASVLSGCSALSVLDTPSRYHISVANRSDYNVALDADGGTLVVSPDGKSALGQRLAWAASFGTADGPPLSEFNVAATDWLKFEKPGCRPSNGRRTAFGTVAYDVTCDTAQAAAG
jgi:hypothetical protein